MLAGARMIVTETVSVPLDSLLLVDAVGGANWALRPSTLGDTLAGAGHAAVEVHSVDTDTWVVLDTEINVLADTETEVAGLGEVALPELVLLDLEATLENFLSLGATDGNVDGNLFVTTDTECSDSVTGLACVPDQFPSPRSFFVSPTYCRQGFDRSTARAPLRHE